MNKTLLLFFLIANCYALISQKYKSGKNISLTSPSPILLIVHMYALLACALLLNGTRIYCYSGGYLSVGDASVNEASSEFHYLDLTSGEKLVIDQVASRWTEIPPSDNFMLEPTIASNTASISETSFVVDGGYYIGGNSHNKTTVYDTESSTWSTISMENRGITSRM
jgi:hypothetical protein